MTVHIAVAKLVNIDANGNVFNKQDATIAQVMRSAGTQARMCESENNSAPNANGQTVTQYLIDEDAAGFNLIHMDQTYVITSDA